MPASEEQWMVRWSFGNIILLMIERVAAYQREMTKSEKSRSSVLLSNFDNEPKTCNTILSVFFELSAAEVG